MAWAVVKTSEGLDAILNLDLLFAYVRNPDGTAQAVSLGGARVDLSDKFADIMAELQEEQEEEAEPQATGKDYK